MSALREMTGVTGDEPLEIVVTITMQNRLGVYPKAIFDKMIAQLDNLAPTNMDAADLRLTYLNYMDEQVLDKQNRFRIPPMHAELFDLNGEVVVVGSGEFLEVTNKKVWMEQAKERGRQMREQAARVLPGLIR
jgi:DNA-binding transcriptional regulator/RsmH inhibitor MraZ